MGKKKETKKTSVKATSIQKSPYYIDFSVYGPKPPIEIQVLKDICLIWQMILIKIKRQIVIY
jgi:hypothetical protein